MGPHPPDQPHPWIKLRRRAGPARTESEHVGFNGRLAAGITQAVGTMPAVYVVLVLQATWMVLASAGIWLWRADPYPFAFLLFLSNCIQLPLMFVIMVGQGVLSRVSDRRAIQTYQDAEAILHECNRLHDHLQAQDRALLGALRAVAAADPKVAALLPPDVPLDGEEAPRT